MWLLLAAVFAGAKPSTAMLLESEWRSLQLLQVDTDRYRVVREPFTVQDGPLTVTVEEGLLVPVVSGHLEHDRRARRAIKAQSWKQTDEADYDLANRGTLDFVGFVLVAGRATFEVAWNERADHLVFANHRVRSLGEPRADWEDVASGAPWTGNATEGLFLSIDPQLREVFLGPDDVSNDPLEIVVYGEKPRLGALARSQQILERRERTLADARIEAGDWIARDRIDHARDPSYSGRHTIIDLHIAENLGDMHLGPDDQPRDIDWLTLLRDDLGVMDSRRAVVVTSMKRASDDRIVSDRITGVPFPPADPSDPRSPPQAPVRLEAEDAYIIAAAWPKAANTKVEVTARLQLRAIGGSFQVFSLLVPRAGSESAFKILSANRDDGVPLLSDSPLLLNDAILRRDEDAVTLEPEEDRDSGRIRLPVQVQKDPYHDRPESEILLVLPEPLPAGERVIIDVRWKDVWPLANLGFLDPQSGTELPVPIQRGPGSGRQDILPRLPGAPQGNPSKFRLRVATTEHNSRVAASGELLEVWKESDDAEWYFVESGHTGSRVPFVNVAVGPYTVFDQKAPDLPIVRMRLPSLTGAEMFASEVRRQVIFFQGFLPPYPWPEHEVFQAPAMVNSYVWVASHEMTTLMGSLTTSPEAARALAERQGKNTAQRLLAHELAHQWWGHYVRPAHIDDFWFAETFAEAYALMYMGAVHGDYEEQMEKKRDHWEGWEDVRIPRASLSAAYHSKNQRDIVYDYGPLVFQELLRARIGHEPYHGALDLLVRDHAHQAITTEKLQHYFELASETDLTDFFDFWVHLGQIPDRVELEWAWDGQVFAGHITSDIPFGALEVPVAVDGLIHWVRVIDGQGELRLDIDHRPQVVALDPDGQILAGKRVVKENR